MGRLNGHVALVTGGSRGIGRGIALSLALEGSRVAIATVSGEAGEALGEIRELGVEAVAITADVSVKADVERMVAEAQQALGPVDILVNNAGVFDYHYTSAWTLDEETWDRLYRVNLKGVYLCCAAVVPGMIEAGWGRIINISSTSGISGGTSGIHYAATKGGVNALTLALAQEVAAKGITVNTVAPSKIETDLFRTAVAPENRQAVVEKIPVGRLGRAQDVGAAVVYFACEDGYTTGQTLVVAGGY